jgi:catechol 2,3-dioxygenase-like lactoylglutathione lyase family enzyme
MGGAGLHDIRWHRPVRPGDRLTASVKIVEKKPLSSRADVGLVFKNYEAFNQHGELALTMQGREFIRRKPAGTGESGMAEAVKGIDHVVVVVSDIEKAERAWQRLGFAVQPRGFHNKLGTANHLMIFGGNYFELIGVVEPNEFNASRREMLAKSGEGLANAALRTDSADVAHKAWTDAGLQPDAVLEFDREVEISGRKERAAIRLPAGMGAASQRREGAGRRRGDRRRSIPRRGLCHACLRRVLGQARGRRPVGRKWRHADPLHDPRALRGTSSGREACAQRRSSCAAALHRE